MANCFFTRTYALEVKTGTETEITKIKNITGTRGAEVGY
jgi:hypothetical protein